MGESAAPSYASSGMASPISLVLDAGTSGLGLSELDFVGGPERESLLP